MFDSSRQFKDALIKYSMADNTKVSSDNWFFLRVQNMPFALAAVFDGKLFDFHWAPSLTAFRRSMGTLEKSLFLSLSLSHTHTHFDNDFPYSFELYFFLILP